MIRLNDDRSFHNSTIFIKNSWLNRMDNRYDRIEKPFFDHLCLISDKVVYS